MAREVLPTGLTWQDACLFRQEARHGPVMDKDEIEELLPATLQGLNEQYKACKVPRVDRARTLSTVTQSVHDGSPTSVQHVLYFAKKIGAKK